MIMKNFLINAKNTNKSAIIWNMIAYTSNSFQSMILLLVLSRDKNYVDSAIFSIAFAVASLLLYVGKYAVRNYQVSDAKNEFTYSEYCKSRFVTVVIMIVASVIYLLFCALKKEYTSYKIVCCILLILVRVLEAVEDVFHGHLQKNFRLDVASKIWGIRTIAYICSFILTYCISKNLLISSFVGLIITFILFVVLNASVYDLFEKDRITNDKNVLAILKNCWPLALSTLITVYIGNSPKYTVDAVLSSEDQTCFNIIFMPVFVIALLGNYIYNPLINKMTELWKEDKVVEFKGIILKQIGVVIMATALIILGGEIIGIKILEILYHVSLMEYRKEFIFLMIAGGGLAIFNFLIIISTIIRKPKIVQYTSIICAMLLIIGSKGILRLQGILYLCVYYAVVILSLIICTFLLCDRYVKKGNIKDDSV